MTEEENSVHEMTIKFLQDCIEKNDTVDLPFEDMEKVYHYLKAKGLDIFKYFEYEPKKGKLGKKYNREVIIGAIYSIVLLLCVGTFFCSFFLSNLAIKFYLALLSSEIGFIAYIAACLQNGEKNEIKAQAAENLFNVTLFDIEKMYPQIKEKEMKEASIQKFLEFIQKDIELIRVKDSVKFEQEIHDLGELASEYEQTIKTYIETGASFDQVSFMEKLIAIESSASTKTSRENDVRLNSEYLMSRLLLLGIDTNSLLNDKFLQYILDDIKKIEIYIYQDYEQELQELYKIALEYVRLKLAKSKKVEPLQQLMNRLVAVELKIDSNIENQVNQIALNADLEKIKEALLSLQGEEKATTEELPKMTKSI